jgi:hypothetical protein
VSIGITPAVHRRERVCINAIIYLIYRLHHFALSSIYSTQFHYCFSVTWSSISLLLLQSLSLWHSLCKFPLVILSLLFVLNAWHIVNAVLLARSSLKYIHHQIAEVLQHPLHIPLQDFLYLHIVSSVHLCAPYYFNTYRHGFKSIVTKHKLFPRFHPSSRPQQPLPAH